MECRILLFAALALSLASAMTLELEETSPGTVHYRIVERGASGSTLHIVAMLGETQYSVTTVSGFNGIAEGELLLMERGEYTVKVKNDDTGGQASATIQIPQAESLMEMQESTEALEEQVLEARTTIPFEEDTSFLVLVLAAGLLILLAVILIYGNPFRQQPPAQERAKRKKRKR